jgi:hypothetical protein
MSAPALLYKIQDSLGSNQRLAAFYNFIYGEAPLNAFGSSEFTGVIGNYNISYDDSLHTGYLLGTIGSDENEIENNIAYFFDNDRIDLTSGNFRVPLDGLNANNISVIMDFEFHSDVHNGILMGCLEKGTESFDSIDFENSKGFNIGVTDRGHLFVQTFNSNGDAIDVIHGIELSKRNLIGISTSESFVELSYFDYLNGLVKNAEIPIDENYTSQTGFLTFGGSENYYRSNDSFDTTFSGTLNNLAIFSGYIDPQSLKDFGEGILGEYVYTAPVETQYQRVTGYSESIVYKTGITGYEYVQTGTLSIHTGREYISGSSELGSSESLVEGERYYKYFTLNNGNTRTFYKEEIGQLHSDSGYVYYPTGEGAYDTLGLNDISESIQMYVGSSEVMQDSISIPLYGKNSLTGVTSEVSGVISTPLQKTYSSFAPASSGVSLTGQASEPFKKNFIYYLGDRS